MPRKSITLFAMLMATIVLFPGCKKEKTAELAATQVASGMLCFNSPEDFFETQQKVLAMSETERREWELQQGFESYATKCNELFEAFEAKGIESDEDIYNFVKENPDYFYIHVEDGEEYLISYLEYTPYYNIVDENRMFQIGREIYKIFDEGIIRTSVDKKTDLTKIRSFYESKQNDFAYYENHVFDSQEDLRYEDDGCDCHTFETIARKTNGNNRTYVRFYIDCANPDILGWGIINYMMKIRPYKRTLGVWYWCRRTISYDINYCVLDDEEIGGKVSGTKSGGVVDLCLHSCYGNLNASAFLSLTGFASTPNARRDITCPNLWPPR